MAQKQHLHETHLEQELSKGIQGAWRFLPGCSVPTLRSQSATSPGTLRCLWLPLSALGGFFPNPCPQGLGQNLAYAVSVRTTEEASVGLKVPFGVAKPQNFTLEEMIYIYPLADSSGRPSLCFLSRQWLHNPTPKSLSIYVSIYNTFKAQ